MPGNHFLRLAMREVKEDAVPGRRGWTIDSGLKPADGPPVPTFE